VAERKDQVQFSPALGERIIDAVAAGLSVQEICASSWAPTPRQLARWRRTIPEFSEAYEAARVARADARSDRIDQALNDLRAGKISAADCRVIVETELKMAARENPQRYGDRIVSDITLRPGAPEDKPDTAAWIDKVLGPVPLLPAPDDGLPDGGDAPLAVEPALQPAPGPSTGPRGPRRWNAVTGKLEVIQ
jgi:hypothetical protein